MSRRRRLARPGGQLPLGVTVSRVGTHTRHGYDTVMAGWPDHTGTALLGRDELAELIEPVMFFFVLAELVLVLIIASACQPSRPAHPERDASPASARSPAHRPDRTQLASGPARAGAIPSLAAWPRAWFGPGSCRQARPRRCAASGPLGLQAAGQLPPGMIIVLRTGSAGGASVVSACGRSYGATGRRSLGGIVLPPGSMKAPHRTVTSRYALLQRNTRPSNFSQSVCVASRSMSSAIKRADLCAHQAEKLGSWSRRSVAGDPATRLVPGARASVVAGDGECSAGAVGSGRWYASWPGWPC